MGGCPAAGSGDGGGSRRAVQHVVDDGGPGVPGPDRAGARGAQPRPQTRVGPQPAQRAGQGHRVAGRHEQQLVAVGEQAGQVGDGSGDDGQAAARYSTTLSGEK